MAKPPKGAAFPSPDREVGLFSNGRKPGCKGLIQTGAFLRYKMHPLCRQWATSPPLIGKGAIVIGKTYLRLPQPSRQRRVHYKTAVRRDALRFCLGKNYMDRGIAASGTARPVLSTDSSFPFREALIKSLSDFILVFLFNARNQSTRIASYLRRLMTWYWIKILMKFDSANESVLP